MLRELTQPRERGAGAAEQAASRAAEQAASRERERRAAPRTEWRVGPERAPDQAASAAAGRGRRAILVAHPRRWRNW